MGNTDRRLQKWKNRIRGGNPGGTSAFTDHAPNGTNELMQGAKAIEDFINNVPGAGICPSGAGP